MHIIIYMCIYMGVCMHDVTAYQVLFVVQQWKSLADAV